MNELRLPCRNETMQHLDSIKKAQLYWKQLGNCFATAANDWYFTHNPICAFQENGHPVSGWKIKECRSRLKQLVMLAKELHKMFAKDQKIYENKREQFLIASSLIIYLYCNVSQIYYHLLNELSNQRLNPVLICLRLRLHHQKENPNHLSQFIINQMLLYSMQKQKQRHKDLEKLLLNHLRYQDGEKNIIDYNLRLNNQNLQVLLQEYFFTCTT